VNNTTEIWYLTFQIFLGVQSIFRAPGSAEIIIYSPNAVVIFQLMLQLAWLGNHVQVHPCLGGAAWRASRLSPAKRAKGVDFWYSHVL
jgi:hypothetical protein